MTTAYLALAGAAALTFAARAAGAQGVPSPADAPGAVPATAGARAAPRDDPGALEPPAAGLSGLVVFTDGRTQFGRIVRIDHSRAHVRRGDDSVVSVPVQSIRGVVPTEVPEGALGGRSEERVVLRDGSVLVADEVERPAGRLVLVRGGSRRELPAAEVLVVVSVRERVAPLGLHDVHLEAPAAVLPRRGEVLLSLREGVHPVFTAGLHRLLALGVGTAVPALHAADYGKNVQLSLRSGLALLPWLWVAGGLHGDFSAGGAVVTASATVTAGSRPSHVTLHAGPVFPGADELAPGMGTTGLALAGTLGFTPWLDGVAEGWLSRRDGAEAGLATLAGRARFGRFALDAGVGTSFPDPAVFPWLSLHLDLSTRR